MASLRGDYDTTQQLMGQHTAAAGGLAISATGVIGSQLPEALKAESRRRVQSRQFFGAITYGSVVARKPA